MSDKERAAVIKEERDAEKAYQASRARARSGNATVSTQCDTSTEANEPDSEFDPASVPPVLGKQPQPEGEVPTGASVPDAEPPSTSGNAKET